VRVLAVHPDVLVATSAIWQTNCVLMRAGEETFVVDSPVLPGELDALPALLEQARFPAPTGLLATHGDWDHLLGRLAFPAVALGCAQRTAQRLRAAPGEARRELRAFDERHLVERSRPLALGAVQALPVPGRCGIGELELELHPAEGHTPDGMAIWAPWARILLAGDYLSSVEIPTLGDAPAGSDASVEIPIRGDASAGSDAAGAHGRARSSLEVYIETLERLCPIVERAAHVIPGHGPVLDSARGLAVLEEDLAYLRALAVRGLDADLPRSRHSAFQHGLHRQNAARAVADARSGE